MLSNSGLSKFFWDEALMYAHYLINRLPLSVIGGKIPMEVWSGKALKTMIPLGYLDVLPTTMLRKISWIQE